jgi:hypothetical protein
VSIKKSVPNLISYLHEFVWSFTQFLAIFFELFSSWVIYFNSEIDRRVGPACQRQCAPCRALIGCCGSRCLNAPGSLKAALTAPFRQPLSERTPELPTAPLPELATPLVPCPDRRPPSRPCRVPTVADRRRALARSEADAVAPEPSMPPSTPATLVSALPPPVSRTSDRANPLTCPRSSLPVVAEPPCRRRPRSPCHPTPLSTPSCRAVVHALVSCATFSPAISRAPVRRHREAAMQHRHCRVRRALRWTAELGRAR